MLEADREARQKGWEIIDIWHSHPDHPARPSDFDRERAWQDWSYLILAVRAGGVTEARSWCPNSDQEFIEERIES